MREVPVPTRFLPQTCRRPVIAIAAWLIALQALLAGVATAHAALVGAGTDVAGAICHGADASIPADPTTPEPTSSGSFAALSAPRVRRDGTARAGKAATAGVLGNGRNCPALTRSTAGGSRCRARRSLTGASELA